MSQAKTIITTDAPGAWASRRSLFGGAALAFAAAAPAVRIIAHAAVDAAESMPPVTDADLIALCTKAEATDNCSSALMATTDYMLPSDPQWLPSTSESARIFGECRQSMNQAAKILAATPDGLRAKASLALREMSSTDFEDYPLVFSVLSQMAGRA